MISLKNYTNQISDEINYNKSKIVQFAKLVKDIKKKKKKNLFYW